MVQATLASTPAAPQRCRRGEEAMAGPGDPPLSGAHLKSTPQNRWEDKAGSIPQLWRTAGEEERGKQVKKAHPVLEGATIPDTDRQ